VLMIELGTKCGVKCLLVEHHSELPDLFDVEELFLDVETKREFEHKEYGGLYPWAGDTIAGLAITANDLNTVWYVPVRHTVGVNVDEEEFLGWLRRVIGTAKRWINHNILIDSVFCYFEGAIFYGELVDTLTLSKVHDSDRMGHSLKPLMRDWLDLATDEQDRVKAYLDGAKSKSYADVPTDIMGEYSCKDVVGNRLLYRYLQLHLPERVKPIWATEIALTSVLFDMEIEGIRIDPQELLKEKLACLKIMIETAGRLAELTGREFTNSHPCIYDILINQLGYPILAYKEEKGKPTGSPTFDADALELYAIHPLSLADPANKEIIDLILKYRTEAQYKSLYLDSFLLFRDAVDHIHPTYNQVVRTGRMSCKRPNIQQQNKRSKRLLKPRDGYGFISCDYSQIEFRLIVHFIEDQDAIAAYNSDPNTDFHQWVADMIRIKRTPAKKVNFGMGYGAGKRRVCRELEGNKDIIEEISYKVNEMVEAGEITPEQRHETFHTMCQERASEIYEQYHETLPGLKTTAKDCERVCRRRGYVFNPYGRRRHLPSKVAHKAFNTLVQGCAMDIIKERMVALSPRNNAKIREWGIRIVANVHDEVLFEVPLELLHNEEVHQYLVTTLSSPQVNFSVPITTGLGISALNWAEAAGDDSTVDDSGRILAGKVL